jgi:hypothetical protein
VTGIDAKLDALLAAHDELGSPLSRCLRAGPPPVLIRERLAGLGLRPPDEVVDWFAWREPNRAAWAATGSHGDPAFFWAGFPMTIDEAIREYDSYASENPDLMDPEHDVDPAYEFWRPTWSPILWSGPGLFVVECGPDRPGAVRRIENDASDGPAAPVLFPSLGELVDAATRAVRSSYEWDGESLQPRGGHVPRKIEAY